MPWDNSCANLPLTHYEGYKVPYGTSGFCNSAVGSTYFTEVVAGGGGPSGCAYGETNPNPNTPAVSGTCKGYAKPIWQQFIAGMPNDGVRDLPDVSLFAANGLWGHYYSYCYSNPYPNAGGAPCTGSPANWAGAGGTSFVAPILAGVQALINQKAGERQGNPDYIYYLIATLEYGANGNSSCASNNGGNSCVFHDITLGDITVNCKGPFNCYDPSGPNGVLSVTSDKYSQAYAAHTGWDFASGIGSLNVTKLVKIWADIAKLY